MAFRNSYTATLNPTLNGGNRSSQPFMSSSISSLSSSVSSRNGRRGHNHASSNISKTYRQASTLFLTRRLPEALTTLLPLVTPPHSEDHETSNNANGNGNGTQGAAAEPALVASASRTTRVKVWSLYLTILNAILELEPDEGKDAFGIQDFRAICNKVRDGEVWEEVVQNGYHGTEADVDADVVINLATLLLAHAKSQELNQKRLENYLSYSQTPNLDLSGRFDASLSRRSLSRHRSPAKGTPGTDTPRDLNARVKILELYTLHVLLRNDEWDYAREFISASPILDEERREAFLQALQSLQEEQQEAEKREKEDKKRQEEELQRELEETARIRAENEERERRRIEEERARREGSEAGSRTGDSTVGHRRHKAPSSAGGSTSTRGGSRKSGKSSRSAAAEATSASLPSHQQPHTAPHMGTGKASQTPRARGKGKGSKAVVAPPTSLGARTVLIFSNLRAMVEQMSAAFQASPMALVRTLLFIIALIVMLGRRNIRERISRILGSGWNKVKATAGMGVKVSYI